MGFGEKLQHLRKSKGMSQEALARQVAVSRQAVSKWELDAAMPDTENIIQISKLFAVTTDYLLDDNIEAKIVLADKNLDHFESENQVPTAAVLEKQPIKQKKAIVQICLIVLAIYMITFSIAIMTQPKFLPFFAMIATAISIVVAIMMTRERS